MKIMIQKFLFFVFIMMLSSCGSGGGSNAPLQGINNPLIAALTPLSGKVGTSVTITGSNFSATAKNNIVTFDGTTAVVTSSTATQIVAVVPEDAMTGPVSVKINDQTATSPINFTVTRQMGGSIQQVTELSISNSVSTLAGSAGVYGSTDGVGTAAQFNSTGGITTDGANLYLCDSGNSTIRKVEILSGKVTTVAGAAGQAGSVDGVGTASRFVTPIGITTDGIDLYVADSNDFTIRKINLVSSAVTTIAGTSGIYGSDDGIGSAARFNGLTDITTDGKNLYAVDSYNKTIRKIVISTGVVTTIAGSVGLSGSADGIGPAARFSQLGAITTDGTSLYVTDNSSVRKMDILSSAVATMAGSPVSTGSVDGIGTSARFNSPSGITTDGTSLYVSDLFNSTIRKVTISTGSVSTIAGTPGRYGSTDGIGAAASFTYPGRLTTNGTNLFVGVYFTIRRIE